MQCKQLKIKVGTELVLPSGKAVQCVEIASDRLQFRYAFTGGYLWLTREFIIKNMPDWVA